MLHLEPALSGYGKKDRLTVQQLDRQIKNAEEKLARQIEMTEGMENRAKTRIADLKDQSVCPRSQPPPPPSCVVNAMR